MEEKIESVYEQQINKNFELIIPIEIQNCLNMNKEDEIRFVKCNNLIVIEKTT